MQVVSHAYHTHPTLVGTKVVLVGTPLFSELLVCTYHTCCPYQPSGHNAARKSMIDAILCGCIPVFVCRRQVYEHLWPLHFGWKHLASVSMASKTSVGR